MYGFSYVVNWKALDFPIPWDRVFGWSGPLVVEIGFGNGDFLVETAPRRPGTRFVGIEISRTSVLKASKRLRALRIRNVRLVHWDARPALQHLFAPGSLHEVHSYFPDPWPKKRHEKRRLFSLEFCKLVASRLKTGGRVILYTDDANYFAWVSQNFRDSRLFRVSAGPAERIPDTKYAQKWLQAGKSVYALEAWKTRDPEEAFPIVQRLKTMPNVVLRCEEEDFLARFVQHFQALEILGGIEVRIPRAYLAADKRSAVFETFLREKGIQQRFFLEVKRLGQRTVIKVHDAFDVVATPGVKLAVTALADALVRRGCRRVYTTTGL